MRGTYPLAQTIHEWARSKSTSTISFSVAGRQSSHNTRRLSKSFSSMPFACQMHSIQQFWSTKGLPGVVASFHGVSFFRLRRFVVPHAVDGRKLVGETLLFEYSNKRTLSTRCLKQEKAFYAMPHLEWRLWAATDFVVLIFQPKGTSSKLSLPPFLVSLLLPQDSSCYTVTRTIDSCLIVHLSNRFASPCLFFLPASFVTPSSWQRLSPPYLLLVGVGVESRFPPQTGGPVLPTLDASSSLLRKRRLPFLH